VVERDLPATALLRVTVTGATVAVKGDLDLSTAPLLDRALREAVDPAPARVDLDMRELSFLDASGVSVILRAWHLAEDRGTRLRLVGPGPFVRRVLEITRVTEVCEVVDPPPP
jgi:anti-sigma B factor antagonist